MLGTANVPKLRNSLIAQRVRASWERHEIKMGIARKTTSRTAFSQARADVRSTVAANPNSIKLRGVILYWPSTGRRGDTFYFGRRPRKKEKGRKANQREFCKNNAPGVLARGAVFQDHTISHRVASRAAVRPQIK